MTLFRIADDSRSVDGARIVPLSGDDPSLMWLQLRGHREFCESAVCAKKPTHAVVLMGDTMDVLGPYCREHADRLSRRLDGEITREAKWTNSMIAKATNE